MEKKKSLMYGFVDECTSPVGGNYADSIGEVIVGRRPLCINDCAYCWATEIKENHPEWQKYRGHYRLEASALKEYPDEAFVFLQDMGDIGDPLIPIEVIKSIFGYIASHPKVTYLLLTKCPEFYLRHVEDLKRLPNIIYGVTIETNRFITSKISKAPPPSWRFSAMKRLRHMTRDPRILVSVEPVMEFDMDSFEASIVELKPWKVACGFDNHPGNHPDVKLPEPKLEKVLELIRRLEARGIDVHRKTLREAKE